MRRRLTDRYDRDALGNLVRAGTTPKLYRSRSEAPGAETGLDFFGARYLSAAQSRQKFKEFIGDPQNFNAYAYLRNNPLRYTDPTGTYTCNGTDKHRAQIDAAYNAAKAAAANDRISQAERKKISAVLKFLGKPGERNDVGLRFGNDVTAGARGETSTFKIGERVFTLINLDAKGIAGKDTSVVAEILIHEGTHGLDDFPRGRLPETQA